MKENCSHDDSLASFFSNDGIEMVRKDRIISILIVLLFLFTSPEEQRSAIQPKMFVLTWVFWRCSQFKIG